MITTSLAQPTEHSRRVRKLNWMIEKVKEQIMLLQRWPTVEDNARCSTLAQEVRQRMLDLRPCERKPPQEGHGVCPRSGTTHFSIHFACVRITCRIIIVRQFTSLLQMLEVTNPKKNKWRRKWDEAREEIDRDSLLIFMLNILTLHVLVVEVLAAITTAPRRLVEFYRIPYNWSAVLALVSDSVAHRSVVGLIDWKYNMEFCGWLFGSSNMRSKHSVYCDFPAHSGWQDSCWYEGWKTPTQVCRCEVCQSTSVRSWVWHKWAYYTDNRFMSNGMRLLLMDPWDGWKRKTNFCKYLSNQILLG